MRRPGGTLSSRSVGKKPVDCESDTCYSVGKVEDFPGQLRVTLNFNQTNQPAACRKASLRHESKMDLTHV